MEPISDVATITRNQRRDVTETTVKPNTTDLNKKSDGKMNPIIPAILIDQCLIQPSSEKLSPGADRNRVRGPQPNTMQLERS